MSEPLLHITLSTHNFTVNRFTPRMREVLMGFARQNVLYGLVRVPGGKFLQAPTKVFGAASADRTEFRFHINQYQEFLDHLKRNFVTEAMFAVETKEVPQGVFIHLDVKDKREPYEDQPLVIEYLNADNSNRSRFVDLQTGKGKLQPLSSKIKIPGGWSTMGEMSIGTKVIAKDGTTTEVTGVFPQGIVDIYKVTFADGRSTEAGAEHLWKVYYINTTIKRRWRIVNTLEVLRLISMPNPRVYIDLCDSELSPEIELPLDPYFLGLLLGNGGFSGGGLRYTTQDLCTVNYIKDQLPVWMGITHLSRYDWSISTKIRGDHDGNVVMKVLRSLGLQGTHSDTKFIPKEYLNGSTEQRLSILQGLLDTDGTVQKSGSVSYCSTSKQLAEDVQYLVRSLGGIAALRPRQTYFTYNGEKKAGLPAFEIDIRFKKATQLFRVERKRSRTNDDAQYADILKLRVASVELVGKKEAQCISIDHPEHLYITDDFIVTHNTFCALRGIGFWGKRTVIIVKPMYMEKWAQDVNAAFHLESEDVIMVRGSAHLMALINQGKCGLLDAKFIIISNRTMQDYLKLYELHRSGVLDLGYDCLPEDFFACVGAGMRLIDEVHQDFHLNYKLDLYTNIERSISLSATLINNDPFMTKMYHIAYPAGTRYTGSKLDKYVVARAVMYGLRPQTNIKTSYRNNPAYSHAAFEESILKSPMLKDAYFKIIWNIVEIGFMSDYKKGERCSVFCSSVDMCTEFSKFLIKKYPHLDVRRYVQEDDYSNLLDADIRVTTILSGGTAHDISMLKTVILTIAVDSIQANIQTLGRLRKIKDLVTKFYYMVCTDIPKHLQYHQKKASMLQGRAASYQVINSPFLL